MRPSTQLLILLLAWRGASAEAVGERDEEGFVPIFDGATLEGWEEMPAGAVAAWSVVGGAIRGDGDKAQNYLTWRERDLADFELRFRYRFPRGKGNSGVSIRAVPDETGKRAFKSYHADLGHVGIGAGVLGAWDFHTPGRREHSCPRGTRLVIDADDMPTAERMAGAIAAEEISPLGWNDARVVAEGNRFRFFINGKPASEFTEHLPEAERLRSGMLQLQLHDPGMVVEFKDLRLRKSGVKGDGVISDDFRAGPGGGWRWLRENPDGWRVGGGGLQVLVEPGNMWGAANDARNVMLMAVPEALREAAEVRVTVAHAPEKRWEQANLVWFYGEGAMVKLGLELEHGVRNIVMGREEGDRTRTVAVIPFEGSEAELRFRVGDGEIAGAFRSPGGEWREAGSCALPVAGGTAPQVSLQFYQGEAGSGRWATVKGFRLGAP